MRAIPPIAGPMIAAAAALALAAAAGASVPAQHTPYWASISASKARMRAGPGKTYPATWIYVRPELPVKVIGAYKEWRKVEDPGGAQGWMLANLLSDHRSGFVPTGQGAAPIELREQPKADAKVTWRAAPGVVGRLSQCANAWCRFDVHGQSGYVEQGRLWGVDQGEAVP